MSYYRGGPSYPQQPLPGQPYAQQYQQYQQQSPQQSPEQTQDGTFTGHYAHPQAGQGQQFEAYSATGGPVQQSASGYPDSYTSPRIGSSPHAYQPQSYPAAPATYNPQHYAAVNQPQQTQYSPAQSYNPQAYAAPHQTAYAHSNQSAQSPDGRSYPNSASYDRSGYSPGQAYSDYQSQGGLSPPLSQYNTQSQYSSQIPLRRPSYAQPPGSAPARQQSFSVSPTAHAQHQGLPFRPAEQRSPPPTASTAQRSPPHPRDQWASTSPTYHASSAQSPGSLYPTTSNMSLPSPQFSSPGPTPPAHSSSIRSTAASRHPQARPLPGPPVPSPRTDYFDHRNVTGHSVRPEMGTMTQEELFNEVEDAVMNAGSRPTDYSGPRDNSLSQERYRPSYSRQSTANGQNSPGSHPVERFSDESDAEAAQGLAMMRAAEEDERRRSGGHARLTGTSASIHQRTSNVGTIAASSDSDDYGTVDMSLIGGGYDVHMTYGGDPNQLAGMHDSNNEGYAHSVPSQQSSMRRSHASQSSRGRFSFSAEPVYRPYNSEARVDAVGTGGLSEPTGRRQSYDEGDEDLLTEGQLPERFPDEPPDISFNAASTSFVSGRPLPPPPLEDVPFLDRSNLRADIGSPGYYSVTDMYGGYGSPDLAVPRSSSFVSHSNTPPIPQPLRSKTDAEERNRRQQQQLQQQQQQLQQAQLQLHSRAATFSSLESAPVGSAVPDLPSLSAKRFVPAKLGASDYKKCSEPWSLSAIMKWLLTITSPEQYSELKEVDISDALTNLFTNKVPTMNIADAEGIANCVIQNMYKAGTLVSTEEWVKLAPGPMSGVIFQLTGSGCYAPNLHDHIVPGRCYSHFCQRTLKKLSLHDRTRGSTDWAQFYNLERSEWENKDKKELEQQYILHEIVHTEDSYIDQLSVLQALYRDPLAKVEPSIVAPSRRDKFIKDVFGRLDAVKQANLDHLLPQLKYRQQEQGPFIGGFSDIFRQWIRKAKAAYLDYAGGFPGANFLMRNEIERNLQFRAFIERASKDPRSVRLGWDTYLKAPITRLQRYSLLLSTVLKNMKTESEEKRNLKMALDEIKAVTQECDVRVAEMARKVDLTDLGMKLKLRPGMQNAVELNLDHFGREIIHRGDLQRMGGNRFTWLDSHAILFDHYLVIAKTVTHNSEQGGRVEKYDVSRLPIPMDLLVLESANEGAVQKSSYVKGITSVSTVSGRTASPADAMVLGRPVSNQSPAPGGLQHANTGSSSNSLQPVTSLSDRDSERIMYPFKVKHLGRDTYTLFAPNETARNDWVSKITEAKTKHAAALYAQHAEPFHLRVMADSAFVFDSFAQSGRSVAPVIKGTPIYRAVREVEHRYKDVGRPGPICRARVNCATTFTTPYPSRRMVAVGTDFGVYLSDIENPRGWNRAISMSRVTQIAVLEEFNLFLLISDKVLIAYHLDVICPNEGNGPAPANDSARRAPQKLSGSKDVGFFVSGRMKDRTLVFYKKRENLNSVFKVLEPIYHKSTEKKRGVFKRGTTEFFREYDEFYVPAESSGINLFHSSLSISTARGFEVLTLDKKQPWTIPDLRAEHVQNIASHIKDQKALGMLRLTDQEFLLCYSNCAVYVNKHGDVSRSVIMDFVGTAQSAALYGVYLILFDTDFVEIRNASNGRLKQIISGREIKCLDDGGNWSSGVTPSTITSSNALGMKESLQNGGAFGSGNGGGSRTVKFVMQHPESEKTQLVVELLLNEKTKE